MDHGGARAQLANDAVVVELDRTTGALLSLSLLRANKSSSSSGSSFQFRNDSWAVRVRADGAAASDEFSPRSCVPSPDPDPAEEMLRLLFSCTASNDALFFVRAGYLLPRGHGSFVEKQLAVCRYTTSGSGECDADASFVVESVDVWTGLEIVGPGIQGPHHSVNPYNNGATVASFWRRPAQSDGVFASVMNPFFTSGPPPPPPPPSPHANLTWLGRQWETFNSPPAAWTVVDSPQGPLLLQLDGASSDEAVLPSALPGGFGTARVDVSFSSVPTVPHACAGLLVGAEESTFGRGDNHWRGWEVSVSPQDSGFVVLAYHDNSVTQLSRKQVDVPLHAANTLEVSLSRPPAGGAGVAFKISVNGKVALTTVDLSSSPGPPGPAVALRGYQTNATFTAFGVAPAVLQPPADRNQPLMMRTSMEMEWNATLSGPWHVSDSGVIGLTELSGYAYPETGTTTGEVRAFTACVEHYLLDTEARAGKALRYNAAWDCNEYQLDVSRPEDVDEYKRIVDRNAEIGIPNQVFEPRNTAVSTRFNATDSWEWEQVLMFALMERFRTGSFRPGVDPLPPTVEAMMGYFREKGVRPTAYFYPILNFQHPDADDWLYPFPGVSGQRASLASVKLQNYLVGSLDAFMDQTGAIGFAWDCESAPLCRAVSPGAAPHPFRPHLLAAF